MVAYPRLEWSEPEPDQSGVIAVSGAGSPATMASVRRQFTESRWAEATRPRFTVWLSKNEFFQIAVDTDSKMLVGIVRTASTMPDSPLQGGSIPKTRKTECFRDDGEPLSLLESYLKQDGSFDREVRWANTETEGRQP